MDSLGIVFLVAGIVGGILYAWTFTKPGKKWLENL